MKKYFEIIGFIVLALFSFYYTSKTTIVVKNTDSIMINIKDDMENHKIDSVDAIINGDEIVPGLSGREVDVSKSYDAMKKVGTYSTNMLVYKNIKPNVSISNIYNKYISKGNKNKKQVSLIFKVDEKDNIDTIIKILDDNKVKANFFTLDKFDNSIISLTNKEHNIGSVNNETWLNTVVTKIKKQKNRYCYLEEKNKEVLDICALNKNYTIVPNILTDITPTITIKKNLESGVIISMDVNNNLYKELEYIIKYIKSKGFDIVNLDELLAE